MKKKTISLLLAMAMAATTMAGCMTVNAEEASFDGTIRWLNYNRKLQTR